MGQVLDFPHKKRRQQLLRLAENLWMMKLNDTPEAQAQADRIVKELRDNNYVVPDYMKGNDYDKR